MDIWKWNGTPTQGEPDKGGSGGSSGTSGPSTTPVAALSLTVGKLKGSARKGFRGAAACSRTCDISATLTIDKPTAKKLKLGKKAVRVAKFAKKGVTGRAVLSFKVAKKLARKIRKGTKLTLLVKAKAADGRSATAKRTVKAG